jgi:hypothetical protein
MFLIENTSYGLFFHLNYSQPTNNANTTTKEHNMQTDNLVYFGHYRTKGFGKYFGMATLQELPGFDKFSRVAEGLLEILINKKLIMHRWDKDDNGDESLILTAHVFTDAQLEARDKKIMDGAAVAVWKVIQEELKTYIVAKSLSAPVYH